MAIQHGYGKLAGTDALVFAYDTGDTRNSFKGEPIENILALGGSDTEAERSGTSYPYYSINIDSYIQERWTPENNTLTLSYEGKRDYVAGGTGGGNDGYPVYYIYFTDWSWASTRGISAYDWAYTKQTFTMPDPSTKSVRFAIYHMNAGNRGRSYSRKHMLTFGDHAVPFVNGVRSETEGLLDLTGNNSIDLSNAGFNSSAEIDFDATSDYIAINNPTVPEGPYTILMIVKPGSPLTPGGSGAGKPNGSGRHTPLVGPGPVWNPGIWVTSDYIRSHAQTQYVDSAINWTTTTWQMIGMTFDGTNVKNIFGDQILPNAHTTGYNPPQPSELLIGAEQVGGSSTSWDGSVAVVNIYNRVLTSAEIKANFNHYKTRFNIA